MKFFLKKNLLFFSLFIAVSLFFSGLKINAQVNFSHSITATYELTEEGKGNVTYYFRTRNITSDNYLESFELNLPFIPTNITTGESPNPINLNLSERADGVKNFTVDFLNPIFGGGQIYDWSFKFEVENLLISHSMQRGIIIPLFINDIQIEDFTINIIVPKSLGELAYAYNSPEITDLNDKYEITYRKTDYSPSNYVLLFGKEQDYYFNISHTQSEAQEVFLPQISSVQEVIYTEFPSGIEIIDNEGRQSVSLPPSNSLRGSIKTSLNLDTKYTLSSQLVTNQNAVNKIVPSDKFSNLNTSDLKVREIFYRLRLNYVLKDYLTTYETQIGDLNTNEVNPAELNQLFREILTALEIPNRGVYGYVYPLQPFPREVEVTDQHVWSEYWNGEAWISVDPVWYIASGGTDYIGNNALHHISFGNYLNFEEIRSFFRAYNYIQVNPSNIPIPVEPEVELRMSFYKDTFLNKEYKIILKNNSNQPIAISSLVPTLNKMNNIKLDIDKVEVNEILPPLNSEVTLTIPLQYGMVMRKSSGEMNVKVNYKDNETGIIQASTFLNNVTISSNISDYLVEVVVGIIGATLLLSIILFTIFRKALFRKKL